MHKDTSMKTIWRLSLVSPMRVLLAGFCLGVALIPTIDARQATAADLPTLETYALLEKFHGHVCGGSLFGARMGHAAKEALRAAGGEGKLKATVFDLSCPVDGIQISAGTTYGNQALTVKDRDERRLVLEAEGNNKRVEATLTSKAEKLALRSKALGKQARALPENSAERQALEKEIEGIFTWLRTAPTAEVVTIKR